jgi:hypothetical protein
MVKFTDHLHVKLNIFYKPQVKKVISQYGSKITLFDIPSQLFSTFCTKDTKYTFSTRRCIKKSYTSPSIMKFIYLILDKRRKLKPELVKLNLILIFKCINLTHIHGLISLWSQLFWVPEAYTSPSAPFNETNFNISNLIYCML